MSAQVDTHAHEDDHGHHPKETFITKYIFCQDHKMIAKQYLITGIIMGVSWDFNVSFNAYANCMAYRTKRHL